jgi:hypothetical protein
MNQDILQFVTNNCELKRTICIAGADTDFYPIKFSPIFKKVLVFDPDNVKFNRLRSISPNFNIIPTMKALSNVEKDISFISNDFFERKTFTKSTVLDSLDLELDCLFIDVGYDQKLIILGGVETIRKLNPIIVIKKSTSSAETFDLLYNVFSYRKKFEDDTHIGLIHHSKL